MKQYERGIYSYTLSGIKFLHYDHKKYLVFILKKTEHCSELEAVNSNRT